MNIIAGFESLDELEYLIKLGIQGIFIPSWTKDVSKVVSILRKYDYRGIVCTDNEGGYASWVVKGIPSPSQIAKLSRKEAYEIYLSMAEELARYLVNLNLAPVVDLSYEGNEVIHAKGRSYSSDPDEVIALASIFMEAHRKVGVETALKHFVGQGRSIGDPHTGRSTYPFGLSMLEEDLKPFKRLAKSTNFIMLSHVIVPEYDSMPISLSARWINFIRNDMEFSGYLITDDVRMDAIEKQYGLRDALRMYNKLDVDFVLISRGIEYVEFAMKL